MRILMVSAFGAVLSTVLTEVNTKDMNRLFHETDIMGAPQSPSWEWAGPADPNELIELMLAIRQSNTEALESLVLAVSDPDNPTYGKHLSFEAVNALIAPAVESLRQVREYLSKELGPDLHEAGCEQSPSGDFIRCVVPVRMAEKLLDTQYHKWKAGTQVVLRSPFYSLPAAVSPHIDFVAPTVRFPSLHRPHTPLPPASETTLEEWRWRRRRNTPASLRELYRVGGQEGSLGKQAATGFLEQYFEERDLEKFWEKFYPANKGRKIKVFGPNKKKAGIEANLDVEYLSSLGSGVETEFWSYAGRAPDNPENEPFLKWMYHIGNTSDADIPKVFSTSYGEAEHTVSLSYMNRINIEFQKAAARGISLLFATGDYGVSDQGRCPEGRFQGQWPAGSPWVTGVGGTEGGFDGTSEGAWFGSAGGFSDRWAVPEYQRDAVGRYFTKIHPEELPPRSRYNATGCGFPDVSAQAIDFTVIDGGEDITVAGTSCACPTFAGIVALLNDQRLRANKSTLGFLNPLFYKHPEVFMDVTKGCNQGGQRCGEVGFAASEGWDPVTGLGSPDFAKMSALVSNLR